MAVAVRSVATDIRTTTGNTVVITEPSGAVDGDILLVVLMSGNVETISTYPSGFSEIQAASDSSSLTRQTWAWWRRSGGGAANYTFTYSGNQFHGGVMYAISGAKTSGSPINALGITGGSGASATVTAPTITTTVANCLLVGGFQVGDDRTYSGYTAPLVEDADIISTGNATSIATASGIQAAAGASGSKSATASGSARWVGGLAAIEPALAVTNQALTATATGTASFVKQVNKTLSATSTGTPSISTLRTLKQALTATATGTASFIKSVSKTLSASGTGTASFIKSISKTLSVTATGTPSIDTAKVILQELIATATGTASFIRQVAKNLTASATGTPEITPISSASQVFEQAMSAIATGVASITMRIGRGRPSSLQHEYNQKVVRRVIEYTQTLYRRVREYNQKVSRDGN